MKRWLVLLVSVLTVLKTGVVWADVDDFSIASFEADYYLTQTENRYARLRVVEKLAVDFPNFDQNHGILRAIPKTYGDYSLEPHVTRVTDFSGQDYMYDTYEQNDNLVLRIGNAALYVQGRTNYVIEYELANVVTFYSDHDELFWDINGDDWPQPFGQVTARIHLPAGLSGPLLEQQRCYEGTRGSLSSDCEITRQAENGGSVVTATASELSPFETLSVVLAWPTNTFEVDPWPKRRQILVWSIGALVPLATLAWMSWCWQKYGRDPRGRGIIVPEYAPPKNLSILAADTILNERLRTEAVSAALIGLATSGYIKVHEIVKKGFLSKSSQYELELTKDPTKLSADDQAVIKLAFSEAASVGDKVNLADEGNQLYEGVQKLQKALPKRLAKEGYFAGDPNTRRSRYYGLGIGSMLVSFFLLALAPWLGMGLLVSGLVIVLFARSMPARTAGGVSVRDHLLGLEDYIKLAEAERLRYLQSPGGVRQYGDPSQPKNQLKLFETLLPFAMLFGLEKDWAKQFEHLYTQPPSWYSGSGHFTTLHLADSLGGLQTQSTRAFTPPSSSGSSGFSGGGAGGGGGGGGGGGW